MDLKQMNNDKPRVIIQHHENPRRRLRVGDPDFVPPDGGWGWLIVFACGFSNLSTFPMFQQFGLVFRQKFEDLSISSAQTTSVINMNSAFNACMDEAYSLAFECIAIFWKSYIKVQVKSFGKTSLGLPHAKFS